MSLNNLENVTELFLNDATTTASRTIDLATLTPKRSTEISQDTVTPKAIRASESKHLDTSRSSDSGKSSSCSPTLLDCSFDSGIAGVLLDSNNMQLHKQIQQCQRIILALERDREHFCTIRKRLSKISERKKKQLIDSEYFCNVCCAEIDPEDAKTYVKCYICQKHICRSIKCADWLAKTAQWECELCQTSKESMAQTSSWVADQISFNQEKFVYPIRARSEIFIPISDCNDSSIHFESVSQIGANSAAVTAEQKHKIREYVEEVVANLLGGNLDTISVNQLSKSENYLPAPKSNGPFGQQNGSVILSSRQTSREVTPISANDPDFSHISENRLRQMILKIIAETQNMPSSLTTTHAVSEIALDRLSKTADNMPLTNGHRHRTEHYFEPTIYQDLLATAVLNKIVDKQLNSHDISERLPDLTRGDDGDDDDCHVNAVLDENFNVEHHSITSGSSVEPRSDCSFTDMEQILNTNDDKSLETNIINADRESVMSDYLANHMVPLPNLSEMATESEEDDYMSVTSSAVGDGTWENNWLFKKKKPTLGGTVTATSIGMLVPDPKEDVRAKIGDKAADEVSDLSELGSDTDDSLDLLRSKLDPINDRLINKHLIGGQNSKEVLDELIERSSMTSNKLPTELEETFTETCNEHLIDAATKSTKSEAINVDVIKQPSCNTEQEDAEFILPPAGFEDLNSNPLTDKLIYDTNRNDDSRTATVEEYIGKNPDESDILANKFQISPPSTTTTTTILTTTTNNHTNTITNKTTTYNMDQLKSINGTGTNNSSLIKRNNHKRSEKHSNNFLLTSPVQNRESPPSPATLEQHVLNNGRVNNRREAYGSDDSVVVVEVDLIEDHETETEMYNDDDDDDDEDEDDDEVACLRHFVPGSIAEREYKKWNNAVEMPNNPYAPEALKRRISGSQERFIDLPNISPTQEQNPIDIQSKNKLDVEERENDYKRYSRDYYINNGSPSSQTSPARETVATPTKDISIETGQNIETEMDLYKAIPVQVVEDTMSQQSIQSENTTTSDDSDTIRIYDFKKQATTVFKDPTAPEVEGRAKAIVKPQVRPTNLNFSRSECTGNGTTAARGSTPTAFKFLQPKRKLVDPSRVLSVDEDESTAVTSPLEKPVIEQDVVHALPSVKALAKAFLMTAKAAQPENRWLRKVKTLSQAAKKPPPATDSLCLESAKVEEDITITSDLSSLETDTSLSLYKDTENTKDISPTSPPEDKDTDLVSLRQGGLKNNIAFFENLKFK